MTESLKLFLFLATEYKYSQDIILSYVYTYIEQISSEWSDETKFECVKHINTI